MVWEGRSREAPPYPDSICRNAGRRKVRVAFFIVPILVVSLEPQLTRFLEGAAFVPGDRVSEAKGDPIDSAVLFSSGGGASCVPRHGIQKFRIVVCEQTGMSAPPCQALVRRINASWFDGLSLPPGGIDGDRKR